MSAGERSVTEIAGLDGPARSRPRALLAGARRLARHHPTGAFAAAILAFVSVIALIPAPFAPHDPTAQSPAVALQGVSAAHPFGTDQFGRDVLSRVIHGARASIVIGAVAVAVGLGVATLIGGLAAYAGGWLDAALQRLVDAVMALPWLVLLLSMLALLGPGTLKTALVIGLLTAPGASRVIRAAVLRLRRAEFVQAARALGCPASRILWRHILPNVTTPLVILASAGLGAAILAEASLSFLGFGVVPPQPAWGAMLGVEGRRFLTTAPWLAIFPGAAIALVVLAANLLGDALRDLLDPHARGRRR